MYTVNHLFNFLCYSFFINFKRCSVKQQWKHISNSTKATLCTIIKNKVRKKTRVTVKTCKNKVTLNLKQVSIMHSSEIHSTFLLLQIFTQMSKPSPPIQNWFSDLPGRQTLLSGFPLALVKLFVFFCLAKQKTQLDCGP